MRHLDSISESEALSLRRMLRREARNSLTARVLWIASVILIAATFVVGAAAASEALACVIFILFLFVLMLAAPPGFFSARHDPAKTWEQIHFTLDSLGDANDLLDQIDLELAADGAEIFGAIPSRYRRQTQGTLVLTESWILWFGWHEFRFFPISRIV